MADKNNTANVSAVKGVQGGYCFVAPYGATLPTDNKAQLDAAFKNMGFIGEDGVTFSDSSSSNSFYDMNGDVVDTSASSVEKSWTAKFIEVKKDVLALCYGEEAVSEEGGVIKVVDGGPNGASYSAVFELLLKNGRKWRRVVPQCKPSELGDMVASGTEVSGREVTMSVLKDSAAGAYYVDYIDSAAESEAE